MRYIIGSGPAGVACAYALVQKGLDVTIIDAGLELEPQRREVVEQLSRNQPQEWDAARLNFIRKGMAIESKGVPLKLIYGSDFPYRETDKYIPIVQAGVESNPSLAKAGLSNVWGAGVLPFLQSDIAQWPIAIADLAPHYESVLSFMPFSAIKDDLESLFPLYGSNYQKLCPSKQAVALIEDLKLNQNRLEAQGFKFGYSRLAIRTQPNANDFGCVYCGLCMYGCPYGLIYNTSSTLEQLKQAKNFNYIKDVVVEKIVESNGSARIVARSRITDESLNFEAEKVYLACGVLSTTKIMLESLQAYDRVLSIKDSQYFLLPFLRYRNIKGVVNEKLHTLAQVFIELFDKSLSEHTIHLGIYTYNDLYLSFIQKIVGPLYPLFKIPTEELLGRLMVIQGYLHSDLSPTISVRLEKNSSESTSKLILSVNQNNLTRKVIRGVIAKLLSQQKYLKGIPIPQLLRIAKAGRSFHSGGVFPMRLNPSDFESDILGRPLGFQNVHIVDATVFPSIPATTITLTVMANAHRIASNS
ncbi:hypothetical protein NIES593_06545 [Hydrococcus rivularis NIES-593]|uniref:4Fe-4S ferredoxin-type domain-containing protein n=1 Tax=Hydrococcus rivularis NIES-593 TaxID=1921803 RepID=A0A1U7HMP5_9CYAN|nr:GMC family oxidoreductase N-terminal domain-containing protein [Hydrococcus rivularis]OKH24870.1 hypothetical protein NIES593_06545 [Hydrococcus rivularis NIES-593]